MVPATQSAVLSDIGCRVPPDNHREVQLRGRFLGLGQRLVGPEEGVVLLARFPWVRGLVRPPRAVQLLGRDSFMENSVVGWQEEVVLRTLRPWLCRDDFACFGLECLLVKGFRL